MFMRRWFVYAALTGTLLFGAAFALQSAAPKGSLMPHHAHGTFTVRMGAPMPGPAEGLSRFSMTKELHGGLEGTSEGEMIAGGDYTAGAAGYVAVEVVKGTLDGKTGSFALQHSATLRGGAQDMTIVVVPGSGTGALKGIEGVFKITMKDGQHFYDLDYALPGSEG